MSSLFDAVRQREPVDNSKTRNEEIEHVIGVEASFERALFSVLPQEKIAQLLLDNPQSAALELTHVVDEVLSQAPFSLADQQRMAGIKEKFLDRFLGLGPIEEMLNDPGISEIMVNGPRGIFYEREGKLYRSERTFESDEEVRRLIDQIIAPLGRRIDESTPVVNARLKGGHRFHAIIPPLALDGPTLTIRKFKEETYSLETLADMGCVSKELVPFLRACVKSRKNIAVSGGTGSGKTTFLNTLSQEISPNERIITIEDAAELRFSRHPHVVRLESRSANLEGKGAITLRDLVINSLRMRPDRIVVGEVRGEEALEMLQAMNTGHDGSMTTLHANSEQEVAGRLITMVGYGARFSSQQVLSQIASAFNMIVQLVREKSGERKVQSISLVEGVEGEKLKLNKVYELAQVVGKETNASRSVPRFFGAEKFCSGLVADGSLSPREAQPWLS